MNGYQPVYNAPMNSGSLYSNPFGDLETQLKQQLEQVQKQGQQYMQQYQQFQQVHQQPQMSQEEIFRHNVRYEIDRYEKERQATPAPMEAITNSIGAVLSPEDQQLLAQNVGLLPAYFQSEDGKSILGMVIEGIRKQTAPAPAGAERVIDKL